MTSANNSVCLSRTAARSPVVTGVACPEGLTDISGGCSRRAAAFSASCCCTIFRSLSISASGLLGPKVRSFGGVSSKVCAWPVPVGNGGRVLPADAAVPRRAPPSCTEGSASPIGVGSPTVRSLRILVGSIPLRIITFSKACIFTNWPVVPSISKN